MSLMEGVPGETTGIVVATGVLDAGTLVGTRVGVGLPVGGCAEGVPTSPPNPTRVGFGLTTVVSRVAVGAVVGVGGTGVFTAAAEVGGSAGACDAERVQAAMVIAMAKTRVNKKVRIFILHLLLVSSDSPAYLRIEPATLFSAASSQRFTIS